MEMIFITVDEVRTKDLIPLTSWLKDIPSERRVLRIWYDQVMKNKGRKAEFVKNGGLIALFVNNEAANYFMKYKGLKQKYES